MPPSKVKGGGFEGPEEYLFELTGGSLGLDLANTVDERPTGHPRELLSSFVRLVSWSRQSGVLNRAEAAAMLREGAERPPAADEILLRAKNFREAVFLIFSSLAAGRRPPEDSLKTLNAALPDALSRLRIHRSGRQYRWVWAEAGSLERLLWPVIRSAARLLTSPDLPRIRECAADTCSWLFLDRSRNRSRRWCDMSVCGNRSKARRHYRRTRAESRRSA